MKHSEASWWPGQLVVRVHPHHDDAVLTTFRVDAMAEWYELVLGLQPADGPDRTDGREVRLTESGRSVVLTPRTPGPAPVHQTIVCEFDSDLDLLLSYLRLQARGVLPRRALHRGPGFLLAYQDPDGNEVTVQSFPRGHFVASADLTPVDVDAVIVERSRAASLAWFTRAPDGAPSEAP